MDIYKMKNRVIESDKITQDALAIIKSLHDGPYRDEIYIMGETGLSLSRIDQALAVMLEKGMVHKYTLDDRLHYGTLNISPDSYKEREHIEFDITDVRFAYNQGNVRIMVILEDVVYEFAIPSLNFQTALFSNLKLTKNEERLDRIDGIYRVVSQKKRMMILDRQEWQCNNCGCQLKASQKDKSNGELAHIDHIHPFALRASYPNGPERINEDKNLQALCYKCNISKNTNLN